VRIGVGLGALVALACVLVLPAASAVTASAPPAALRFAAPGTVDRTLRVSGQRAAPGLDTQLASVASVAKSSGAAAAATRARQLGLATDAQKVRVVVTAKSMSAGVAAVQAAGGTVEAAAGRSVQALVPAQSLTAVAGHAGVMFVAPPATPVPLAVGGALCFVVAIGLGSEAAKRRSR